MDNSVLTSMLVIRLKCRENRRIRDIPSLLSPIYNTLTVLKYAPKKARLELAAIEERAEKMQP